MTESDRKRGGEREEREVCMCLPVCVCVRVHMRHLDLALWLVSQSY